MITLERKIDICLRYLASEDAVEREMLRADARAILDAEVTAYAEEAAPEPTHVLHMAEDLLTEVGVPANMNGFEYLVAILTQIVTDDIRVCRGNITSRLYPAAAERFGTNWHNVERCVRNAVDYVFLNTAPDVLTHWFGNSVSTAKSGRATNSQFIAALAIALRRRVGGVLI